MKQTNYKNCKILTLSTNILHNWSGPGPDFLNFAGPVFSPKNFRGVGLTEIHSVFFLANLYYRYVHKNGDRTSSFDFDKTSPQPRDILDYNTVL